MNFPMPIGKTVTAVIAVTLPKKLQVMMKEISICKQNFRLILTEIGLQNDHGHKVED
jgi:hypothetical protein